MITSSYFLLSNQYQLTKNPNQNEITDIPRLTLWCLLPNMNHWCWCYWESRAWNYAAVSTMVLVPSSMTLIPYWYTTTILSHFMLITPLFQNIHSSTLPGSLVWGFKASEPATMSSTMKTNLLTEAPKPACWYLEIGFYLQNGTTKRVIRIWCIGLKIDMATN